MVPIYYADHYYRNKTERVWCLICKSLEASRENQIYTSLQALGRATQGRWLTQSIKMFPWTQHCPNHMNDPLEVIPRHLDSIKLKFFCILLPTIKRVSLLKTLINLLSAATEMEIAHDSWFLQLDSLSGLSSLFDRPWFSRQSKCYLFFWMKKSLINLWRIHTMSMVNLTLLLPQNQTYFGKISPLMLPDCHTARQSDPNKLWHQDSR